MSDKLTIKEELEVTLTLTQKQVIELLASVYRIPEGVTVSMGFYSDHEGRGDSVLRIQYTEIK